MIFFDIFASKDSSIDFSQAIVEYQNMTESITGLGHASTPEVRTPAANHEITLMPGEPASPDTTRDNVGMFPDFGAFAERSRLIPEPILLPAEELHGFDAYERAGGVLSEGLYKMIMDGVIRLQEPGARKKSIFTTPTDWQIKGFEDSHNNPLLGTSLPPEQQIFLTDTQKDAYRIFRGEGFVIPEKDMQKGIGPNHLFSDVPVFEEILKMPDLESYKLYKQEQPKEEESQTLPVAA